MNSALLATWQLVAKICLRLAGKFEEPFNKIYGDADARVTDAAGHRVEAFMHSKDIWAMRLFDRSR